MASQFSNLSEEQALEVANRSFDDKFGHKLTDVETIIFKGSWNDKNYQQIADDSKYSESHIHKDVGYQFWPKLSEALGEEVTKRNFKAAIERKWQSYQRPESPPPPPNYQEETWQKEKTYGQFVGRNFEVEELLKYLESNEKNKVLGIIGISGMGGLGKTALCHQLVSQAYQSKLFPKIAWIRAKVYQYIPEQNQPNISSRDSRLTLEDAIKDLGSELKLPHHILQDIEKCKIEISKILNTTSTLVVIDGLEDTESPKQLANELRGLLGKSTLILTSRKKTESDIKEYQISKFDRDVSREFITVISKEKYFDSQNPILQATEADLDTILNITDGMPLAMKLLVSQLKNCDLDRIIERFENVSEEQKLYDYLFEDSWQELLDLKALSAQKLLILLANRDKPVPVRLMYNFDGLSKDDVDNSLHILVRLSLVDLSSGLSKQASLHSFTARYFRYTLKEKYAQLRR
jgi:NB-ARC domain